MQYANNQLLVLRWHHSFTHNHPGRVANRDRTASMKTVGGRGKQLGRRKKDHTHHHSHYGRTHAMVDTRKHRGGGFGRGGSSRNGGSRRGADGSGKQSGAQSRRMDSSGTTITSTACTSPSERSPWRTPNKPSQRNRSNRSKQGGRKCNGRRAWAVQHQELGSTVLVQ